MKNERDGKTDNGQRRKERYTERRIGWERKRMEYKIRETRDRKRNGERGSKREIWNR